MCADRAAVAAVPSPWRGRRIVESKLQIPKLPAGTILRPRLFQCLTRSVERPLTVVVGPPGAGKTLLLASWLRSRRSAPSAAWVSLDWGDNAPLRFWSHVLEAVRRSGAV